MLLRDQLVVADFHHLVARLAHNAGNTGDIGDLRLGRGRLRLDAGGRDGRRCRGGVRGAILRILIAAQAARSDPRHQQQAGGHGRGLQTGHVVLEPLGQPFIPAHRRQRVQRFIQPKTAAGYEVRSRLGHGKRIGQHLERQQLLPLLAAVRAVAQVTVELVHLVVGQLAVSRRHNPFMEKFAIHNLRPSSLRKVPQNSF